jgi:hypothetical protein
MTCGAALSQHLAQEFALARFLGELHLLRLWEDPDRYPDVSFLEVHHPADAGPLADGVVEILSQGRAAPGIVMGALGGEAPIEWIALESGDCARACRIDQGKILEKKVPGESRTPSVADFRSAREATTVP